MYLKKDYENSFKDVQCINGHIIIEFSEKPSSYVIAFPFNNSYYTDIGFVGPGFGPNVGVTDVDYDYDSLRLYTKKGHMICNIPGCIKCIERTNKRSLLKHIKCSVDIIKYKLTPLEIQKFAVREFFFRKNIDTSCYGVGLMGHEDGIGIILHVPDNLVEKCTLLIKNEYKMQNNVPITIEKEIEFVEQ